MYVALEARVEDRKQRGEIFVSVRDCFTIVFFFILELISVLFSVTGLL